MITTSRLADSVVPGMPAMEWDVPPWAGLVAGIGSLVALGYIAYRIITKEEEEE